MELIDKRFKLTQFDVFQNADQGPGAYALFNAEGGLVWVTWVEDLSQQLMKHLPANERAAHLKGKAKTFCVFSCDSNSEFPAFFDRLVEQTGLLPSEKACIPEGSRFFGSQEPAAHQEIQALLAKVRKEYEADNVDGALQLLLQAGQSGEGVVDFHLLCGQLMAVKGFKSAIKQFEKAAELAPTKPSGIKAAALAERCYDLLVGFQKF